MDKEIVQKGFTAGKKALISLLEHERGHVMAIELASIRVPFPDVKVLSLCHQTDLTACMLAIVLTPHPSMSIIPECTYGVTFASH